MSPSDTVKDEEAGAERGPIDHLAGFGFEGPGDQWLLRLGRAKAPCPLGRLGGYDLLAEVARGGQGVVYRAIQPGTGRLVALKRLSSGSLATETMRRRFAREIEATAALDHPGIVKVFGYEVLDGQPALVMEWVDGITLTRWSAGNSAGRPGLDRVIDMFLSLCAAVEHAHQRGVLHRDLKPANVLVDERGQPRVLDFGIAKLAAGSDRGDAAITQSREFLGTPASAAPEQFQGEHIDARADVYALGGLLYEMLSGRAPFGRGGSVAALIESVLHEKAEPLHNVAPRLPRELDVIVAKALAKEPAQRYQSVTALADDLRRFRSGAPLLAQPPTTSYLVRRLIARRPLAATGVLAVLVSLILFSGLVVWQARALATKRDEAVALREREAQLRRQADAGQARALAAEARSTQALSLATAARASAESHAARSRQVIKFLEDELFRDGRSEGEARSGLTRLEGASEHVASAFANQPELEGAVHSVLGRLYLGLGVPRWSLWHQTCALELRRAVLGDEHPDVARTWRDLGSTWRKLGDDRRAEAAFREALRVQHAVLGDSHADTASSTRSLASLLRARGDFDAATEVLEPLVAIERAHKLTWDPDLAIDLSDLGWSETLRGNGARGEPLLREALALHAASFGADHLRMAVPYERLARVALDRGDLAAAETSLRAALAIRERYRRANRPELAETFQVLSSVVERRGMSEEAGSLRRSADELRAEQEADGPEEEPG
jgi:tetratricopeptide (TPR) repeat protein